MTDVLDRIDRSLTEFEKQIGRGQDLRSMDQQWVVSLARRLFRRMIEVEHHSRELGKSKAWLDKEVREALHDLPITREPKG